MEDHPPFTPPVVDLDPKQLEFIISQPIVRVTKEIHLPDAKVPERSADFPAGAPHDNKHSLPVGYHVTGFLMNPGPLKAGDHIHLFRTNRDGVDAIGFFTGSKILEVIPDPVEPEQITRFRTENSIYRIEILFAPSK